ncbi:Endonuclease/exonuclease/phosphatase [Scheffersomyces amazonensis]|uniref:Endonuclease/exonuclease/phosphatase n=1 Tax=Scheffersomyces amazonensis TaxID=1078765 RepID=UPI00315D2042
MFSKGSVSLEEEIESVPVVSGQLRNQTSNSSIKLLTLNTWGLKFLSKYRRQRIEAIAKKLCEEEYDIVALQELWCKDDWIHISKTCKAIYPYNRVFKSGIVGGPGLAILSKIPIDQTFLYRFPINGRPSAFFRGDWYVGKSIAVTILKAHSKDALPIAILNSHMHAPYSKNGDASYSTHRAVQAWDFTRLVNILRKAGYAVIQVGDLNSRPNSLPHKLFTIEGQLADSWELLNPDLPRIDKLSPHDQIHVGGVTCNSRLNTYRSNSKLEDACRLDYALIDKNTITPLNASVKFTEKLPPPLNCSYSDHFGYMVELLISSKNSHSSVIDPLEKINVYQELLVEIGDYRKYTIPFQANWRKMHFFGSIIFTILFYFLMGFVNRSNAGLEILYMLLSNLILVSGVINGMIWYFGVRSESRALQEVEMEVEDAYFSLKDEITASSSSAF